MDDCPRMLPPCFRKRMSGRKVAALREAFAALGSKAGREAGIKVGKLAFQKIEVQAVMAEVKTAAIAAAEKYSVKAREFCKMGIKIAEEAGAKAGKAAGK